MAAAEGRAGGGRWGGTPRAAACVEGGLATAVQAPRVAVRKGTRRAQAGAAHDGSVLARTAFVASPRGAVRRAVLHYWGRSTSAFFPMQNTHSGVCGRFFLTRHWAFDGGGSCPSMARRQRMIGSEQVPQQVTACCDRAVTVL